MRYITKLCSIRTINAGDIVLHNDKIMTVSKSDIKWCPFMGVSLFGDTYSLGHKKVTKIEIITTNKA